MHIHDPDCECQSRHVGDHREYSVVETRKHAHDVKHKPCMKLVRSGRKSSKMQACKGAQQVTRMGFSLNGGAEWHRVCRKCQATSVYVDQDALPEPAELVESGNSSEKEEPVPATMIMFPRSEADKARAKPIADKDVQRLAREGGAFGLKVVSFCEVVGLLADLKKVQMLFGLLDMPISDVVVERAPIRQMLLQNAMNLCDIYTAAAIESTKLRRASEIADRSEHSKICIGFDGAYDQNPSSTLGLMHAVDTKHPEGIKVLFTAVFTSLATDADLKAGIGKWPKHSSAFEPDALRKLIERCAELGLEIKIFWTDNDAKLGLALKEALLKHGFDPEKVFHGLDTGHMIKNVNTWTMAVAKMADVNAMHAAPSDMNGCPEGAVKGTKTCSGITEYWTQHVWSDLWQHLSSECKRDAPTSDEFLRRWNAYKQKKKGHARGVHDHCDPEICNRHPNSENPAEGKEIKVDCKHQLVELDNQGDKYFNGPTLKRMYHPDNPDGGTGKNEAMNKLSAAEAPKRRKKTPMTYVACVAMSTVKQNELAFQQMPKEFLGEPRKPLVVEQLEASCNQLRLPTDALKASKAAIALYEHKLALRVRRAKKSRTEEFRKNRNKKRKEVRKAKAKLKKDRAGYKMGKSQVHRQRKRKVKSAKPTNKQPAIRRMTEIVGRYGRPTVDFKFPWELPAYPSDLKGIGYKKIEPYLDELMKWDAICKAKQAASYAS